VNKIDKNIMEIENSMSKNILNELQENKNQSPYKK
jgi:predicted transcriptional regulator